MKHTETLDLRTHVELAGTLCRKIFDLQKQLYPMVHAVDIKGEHHLISLNMPEDDDNKDAMMVAVRALLKKHKIIQYVLMVEAWTLQLPPDTLMDKLPRPSLSADRKEIIALQGETKDQSITGHIDITRDDKGNPTLGKLEILDTVQNVGRMTGLLQTAH